MRKVFTVNRRLFALPYVIFMLLFVVLPLVMILVGAFQANDGSFSFEKVVSFFNNKTALRNLWFSIEMGFATTAICLLIGYPASLILSRMDSKRSAFIALLFVLPMWINMLLRTLGTKTLLVLLGSDMGVSAVLFGLVYNFLPFMIMPIYTTLSNMDKSFVEAAQDLGAKPMTVLFKTVVPLSFPGIVSGVTMVFVPTISTFVITSMLSRGNVNMFGDLIYQYFMGNTQNVGVGSVMSIVMLILVLISNLILNRFSDNSAVSKGGVW